MGYVAVKGGIQAIEESIKRLKYERLKKGTVLKFQEIEGGMRCLIDQVMSESSLYSETLAAMAIKQAEGSPEEAVFLLRAYRSTLPRKHYSRTVQSEEMSVERRISSSFKEVPGGQILGAANDYTHRLIDFDLNEETDDEAIAWVREYALESGVDNDQTDLSDLPKTLDYLREEGLIPTCEINNNEPDDVTKESLHFPTSRSQRLQILTRGQTGAVTSLGYAALRSYGALHPTVGELRIGKLPIYVNSPFHDQKEDEDAYYIGEIKVTEVETLFPAEVQKGKGEKEIEFEIGYGICYGQNETKAIAMSILDRCLETGNPEYPPHNEEFVLLHIDSVESTGFISHLKLPHYVTFQSKLDSVRKSKK
ncbi:carbon-phosphorus lyase complex subunit PhnI [Desulfosporosinus nitroreducens]|uniref:Carbon-phosphorus lyase complex subunit PhnI n=1 Tax=Desulfosporosinus nitroreducens TaxID=2018668 RepID=A0ABT8QVL8_9FIRM|nr:carbon-phosphorus lyase complex subunit PhnI [Desulfosporosinus nitroreducens]MCO1601639.1 carbon-phosphorus lyase complex subunit PhnI [Desulfosporosinus nitroreducens]MDO0825220.1 carbon-phosphorus lyase complex subunit PhnI [Desulfosporosinus nitroreducens]